ncbi:hypothetical protein AHAS_Ahas11G0170900 [Arachis hypogaea]
MTNYEQSNQWGYASGTQNGQDNSMGYYPTPQNDSCHYANAKDYLQWSRKFLERQEQFLERQKQSWKEQEPETFFKEMDGRLEKIRRNLGVPSIEDEDQFVKEEVEEQDEEAPVSNETSMEEEVVEVYEPRILYP